jgi:Helitron helicase-like domain at N-terminus
MVGTIGSSAPGTEQKKSHDFTRMKSATVYFGLPQIFITFNPADNVSPVALLYAGKKIEVQTFHPKLYSAAKRLGTMLHNPLAVVEYFRNTVDTIVKTMLKRGMFGELVHYHGPVEYLERAPPPHSFIGNIPAKLSTNWSAMDQGCWNPTVCSR